MVTTCSSAAWQRILTLSLVACLSPANGTATYFLHPPRLR
jgi:hypothetical protein